ncbi:MAG: hypothetical protein M8467_19590 [Anaerolineae bacterium]|nr:hypothetical protein [Anaerolineae bacterium]
MGIAGNLCRCGAYQGFMDAVRAAAAEGRQKDA